jgi:RNA polymerase sigma-70 factor (ECF subfamily)
VTPERQFEELYHEYADRVHAYALRRTTPATADDVVSEVFLVAWRRLDAVPTDPYPWLLGVARRVLANRRRGEARVSALQVRLAAEQRPIDDDGASNERVLVALEQLSERDRELLTLTTWEELGPEELADVLGVRRGTVAVRLHRARQRFAEALGSIDRMVEVSR